MILNVNGVDMLPFLTENGIEWSMNDLESPDAGRTLDGRMHRGRVATKIKMNLTFMPMKDENIQTVLTALHPEYVTVEYTDPMYGRRTVQMYSNNISSTLKVAYNQGTGLWDGFKAPLVER